MHTRWQRSLAGWIEADDATPRRSALALATAAGIYHTTLGRYLSGHMSRPTLDVLQKLTAAIKTIDPAAAVMLVVDHLHDELHASGLTREDVDITAVPRGAHRHALRETARANIDDVMDGLRQHATRNGKNNVYALLCDLLLVLDSTPPKSSKNNSK